MGISDQGVQSLLHAGGKCGVSGMLQELSAFFYAVILAGGVGQCGRPGQGLLGIKVLAGYPTVLYLIGIIVLVPVEDGEVGVVGQGRKSRSEEHTSELQ